MGHTARYQEAERMVLGLQATAENGNSAIDGPGPAALAGEMTPPPVRQG